jgi:hypothetical protein
MTYACHLVSGDSVPATLGFSAVAPEWLFYGAADATPAIPAAESTLGSHPCVALSSAQVFPEWANRNLAGNAFASNGDNPLNFVSHAMGSLQGAGIGDWGLGFRHSLRNTARREFTANAADWGRLEKFIAGALQGR